DQYCVGCHNEKLKTAGLMLDKMDLAHVTEHADVWEKVIRKLRTGAMPPAGRPQPGKDKSDLLAAWLESELDRAAAANPNPGNPARAEVYEIPKGLVQTDRISEDLPFGSRGGIAVHHHFPLDGEYVLQVRLQRANDGNLIQGLAEERQIDVRIDGERIKLFKV